MRTKIKEIKSSEKGGLPFLGKKITLCGWLRTARKQKTFTFLELNDGSTLSNFQIIVDETLTGYQSLIPQLGTGTAVCIKGEIVESPGSNQAVEMKALSVEVLGTCDQETYPLQKKRHSNEFLRTIAHLRPRTNFFSAVSRIRNRASFATHNFFQERGFNYLHSPIITASDCEGAGELFRVTTYDPTSNHSPEDFSDDFFEKPAFLTVSGQLNAEIYATALSDVYTFGPTFRAENSNTSRHLAEFWMIEPEIAFAGLKEDMELAEAYIKYMIEDLLNHCEEDLSLFDKFVSKGQIDYLKSIQSAPFERVPYTEAIKILEASGQKFDYPVKWGIDLQSEHERFLAENHFKTPVILTDYPKEIKAFYMRQNDDGKTVAAMDVIVPKVGEIIGGSQREERLDVLEKRIEEVGLNKEDYWWYLDLRKYGSVPHAGFGVGFERLIQFLTGIENIRDTIPFPRYPGHADF